MTTTYTADFWYRHESDTDQSVRTIPQMTSNCTCHEAAIVTAEELREQGYTIQRIDIAKVCPTCEGNGRIAKGKRNAKKPAWMQKWIDCATCHGHGHDGFQTLFTR